MGSYHKTENATIGNIVSFFLHPFHSSAQFLGEVVAQINSKQQSPWVCDVYCHNQSKVEEFD